jgi:hypothetical protein
MEPQQMKLLFFIAACTQNKDMHSIVHTVNILEDSSIKFYYLKISKCRKAVSNTVRTLE